MEKNEKHRDKKFTRFSYFLATSKTTQIPIFRSLQSHLTTMELSSVSHGAVSENIVFGEVVGKFAYTNNFFMLKPYSHVGQNLHNNSEYKSKRRMKNI